MTGEGVREDVVVVGGGAVGVSCAYALARSGRSVRLLERDRLCAGSSWGNAGLVTTSSSAPEAAPGVVRQAARWLVEPNAPFRLRPRLDPALARWVWRFRAHCTAEAALHATCFLRDRVRDNLRLVEELARASDRDFGFRQNGLLALFATERGLAEGLAHAATLRELGIVSEELDAAEVARREPRATGAILGGVHYPEDAHLDPGELVAAVAELARAHGARLDERTAVVRLHGAHRVEALETSAGTILPGTVVLASGAWTARLARGVGFPVLVEPAKGFSLTYAAGGETFGRPLRLWELRSIVTALRGEVRVTSKLDLVGLDPRVREGRVRPTAAQAARYVRLPPGIEGARAWAGLRPLTPDGLPLLGRARGLANLVFATGHGHLGISLAAITGETVASIVAGDGPDFDPEPLRPDRFARRPARRLPQKDP
jgi:D-amino-acid dehydrogenase